MDLIGAMETQSEPSELELDDVVITNPHIEAILENEDWIEDASYVLLSYWWQCGVTFEFQMFMARLCFAPVTHLLSHYWNLKLLCIFKHRTCNLTRKLPCLFITIKPT